jgi:hypothetical protein
LIDPAVVGSDVANALSAQTKVTPLDATGKSVADLLAENGFTNFTAQDAAGNTGAAPAGDAAVSDIGAATVAASTEVAAALTTAAVVVCGGAPAATGTLPALCW